MKKVAFVCVHNSCRSQMAEAFGKVLGLNVFESYSAGTEERDCINPDAVRMMKEIGIDMTLTQCPHLPCTHREDWGLEDPSGKSDEIFRQTRDVIKEKMEDLVERIRRNEL